MIVDTVLRLVELYSAFVHPINNLPTVKLVLRKLLEENALSEEHTLSAHEISMLTRCNQSTVRKVLNELERLGIVSSRLYLKNGGGNYAKGYWVNLDKLYQIAGEVRKRIHSILSDVEKIFEYLQKLRSSRLVNAQSLSSFSSTSTGSKTTILQG